MNILVVSEYFYPRLTGGEIVLWTIFNGLAAEGHKVYVVTSSFDGSPDYETVNGIEIFRPFTSVDLTRGGNCSAIKVMAARSIFAVKLYRYLQDFLKKYAIDLLYNMAYIPTLSSTCVAHRNKIPCVTGIDSFGGLTNFQIYSPLLAAINCLMEILVLRFGKHKALRCGSAEVVGRVQKYTRSHIINIPCPLNDQEIRFVRETTDVEGIRRNMGIPEGWRFLLFVGSLVPVKNVDGLIRAAAGLTVDYNLVIAGDGPDRASLEKLAQMLGVAKRVKFLGLVPHLEALRLMRACDVLILPSKSETFSMVVIESLALGTPVISTLVGVVPELDSPNLYKISKLEEITDDLLSKVNRFDDCDILESYSLTYITSKFEKFFSSLIN